MYVKITPGKENFAKIAEFALGGGILDRFIVTNDEDRNLLMKIRKKVGCSNRDCGIFQVSEGRRYDVPPPPCNDIETVESVLSIENDMVYNCLVDNCKIDVKALSASKEDSEQALLIEDNQGRESIRGGQIQQVYLLPKGDFWQVRGGNRSMVSNDGGGLKQTIGVDKSEAIENAKRELQMLEGELTENRSRESKVLEESKSVKLKWNQENREARKTDKIIKTLQDTLDALHEEADSAENVTIDTTELEEDVKNAESELEKLQEKEVNCQTKIEENEPIVEEIKRHLDEISTRNESVMADMAVAEKKLIDFNRARTHQNEILNKKKAKLNHLLGLKDKHNADLTSQIETTNETMDKARLLTYHNMRQQGSEEAHFDLEGEESTINMERLKGIEPTPTDKDPKYYRGKIENNERKIRRERERRKISEVDPAVAFEKFKRAEEHYTAKVKTINDINEKMETLQEDLSDRRKRWKIFRKHIATMTNETFDDMLNKKGSCGQIEFDHRERTLDLIVQKDNTNENTQTSDVKALR